jgi:hypothetical protein
VASASGATPTVSKGFRRFGWVMIAVFVFYATTGRNLSSAGKAIPGICMGVFIACVPRALPEHDSPPKRRNLRHRRWSDGR